MAMGNPLSQGWKRPCVRCRISRHDRCAGPMDCGCDDPSHFVDELPPPDADQLADEEQYVIIPIAEIASRLSQVQWIEVGRMRGWFEPVPDLDAPTPPE